MHGDVIGLVALYLILRVGRTDVMRIALIIHVAGMDPDDPAADIACFGVSRDMVANPEAIAHFLSSNASVMSAKIVCLIADGTFSGRHDEAKRRIRGVGLIDQMLALVTRTRPQDDVQRRCHDRAELTDH